MKQLSVIASAILMSGLILLGFQNCGQPGQLVQNTSENPVVLSNALEIGAPEADAPPASSIPINDEVHAATCIDIVAADVLLSVGQVACNSGSLKLVDAVNAVSLAQPAIHLEASASGIVREIRLILNASGNQLMGSNGSVYDLKTPSAQTSGFKIKLAAPVKIIAGKKYDLKLAMDLSQHIVRAGKKCMLHPNIHNAILTEL